MCPVISEPWKEASKAESSYKIKQGKIGYNEIKRE